jgi:YidC/Oxa1 family membrane protein insertase
MTKNFIAFILVSIAILAGWMFLQRSLAPPKPPEKKDDAVVAKMDDKKPDEKKDDKKVDDKKAEEKQPGKKDEKQPKVDEKKVEPVEAKKETPPPPPAKAETFTLGDDESFLKVLLTNRGAAVRKLTLTRFEAADYLGRPVKDKKLEFIQDDPELASFRMYDYATPGSAAPLLGLGEAIWSVEQPVRADASGWSIVFAVTSPNHPELKIRKTYRLGKGDYHVGLSIELQDLRDPTKDKGKFGYRYQLTGAHGLPVEGEWYTSPTYLHNSYVGVVDASNYLSRTMEDSNRISYKLGGEKVSAANAWIQYAGVANQYFASVIVVDPEQPSGDWKRSRILEWARPTLETTEVKSVLIDFDTKPDKDGNRSAEFKIDTGIVTMTLLPRAAEHLDDLKLKKMEPCVLSYYRMPGSNRPVATWMRRGTTPKQFFDDITIRVHSEEIRLEPGEKIEHRFMLYHGPVKTKLLGQFRGNDAVDPKLVDKYTYGVHLRTLTDYHSDTSIGYFFSKIGWTDLLIACTNLMHWLLYWLQFLVGGQWGLAIILLTVVVRGAMHPISRKQALMSQKMQELAPELKKLQEKYKGDKQGQAQATFELYRKHKINPVGAGCLPLLLQMPVFLGLYYALQESIQFRLASFLWIKNLAAPDMLFPWGEWNIPILDWFTGPDNLGGMLYLGPYFNLLPIFAVALMVIQQKMLTPPAQTEEQEMQQKMMKFMMAFMGIFFYKIASGLCIYFIASSLWGVAERKLLPKKKPADAAVAPTGSSSTAIKSGAPNSRDRRREREQRREKIEEPTAFSKLKEWWRRLLESAEKK